ncbi:MAG: peptidylprolyl isomerase [Anaerolineales bacterium]
MNPLEGVQIADNTVAEFYYSLTLGDGELIDQSEKGHPLAYLHGNGNIISGLENALTGKSSGDKFTITLEPEHAYGEYDDALQTKVVRSQISDMGQLEVGMQLEAQFPDGTHMATIQSLDHMLTGAPAQSA